MTIHASRKRWQVKELLLPQNSKSSVILKRTQQGLPSSNRVLRIPTRPIGGAKALGASNEGLTWITRTNLFGIRQRIAPCRIKPHVRMLLNYIGCFMMFWLQTQATIWDLARYLEAWPCLGTGQQSEQVDQDI